LYQPSKILIPIVILNLLFFTYSETTAKEFTPTTLPNGMRVLVVERPLTNTVTINLYIGIGRINEPVSGAANLLMHVLFRGSNKYPARKITEEVARMGGTLDYHVGYLSTSISISLPSNPPNIPPLEKGGKGGFDRAITLLADIILNPVLDTDELEKERTLILQKLAISKDFPVSRFFKEIMLRQFPDHPFGRGAEGTEDSVKKLNAESLRSYHKEFYVPNNISVVIVGNITKELVEASLTPFLSPPSEGGGRGVVGRKAPDPAKPIINHRIVLNEHVTQAQIFVGRPVPGLNQKERHILLAINQVLSGLHGRLFNILRKKKGCVYSVGIWDVIYPEIGLWGVYAGTRTGKLRATERLIVSELERLIRQPVEPEELATAQKLLETAIRTEYETNSSLAQQAGSSLVKKEAILTMEERIKLVQSATPEDIKSLAKKLFDKGEFNVIIMK
jgi:predicted Zn-dependent peptidase